MDFLGVVFRNYSRFSHSLVRQWIHVGFSLRGFWKYFTHFFRSGGLQEMTSCLSPYSALSFVRLRKVCGAEQLQVVVILVITQRQIPMVLVTKEMLLLLDKVIDVPVVQVVQPPGGGLVVQKTVVSTVAVPVSSLTCPLLRTRGLGGVAGAVPARWCTSLCCRSDKFQLSVLTAGTRGRLFRALYTGTGLGIVSTGTRPP